MNSLKFKFSPIGWEPLVAVLILLGAATDWASQPKPDSAAAYHRAIRVAAAGIPMRIGDWIGKDVPVARGAVEMLHPNVIVNRQYVNAANGIGASVLLVQCGDARDIEVHYPPACMVNAGWTMVGAEPHDWLVGPVRLTGTEYRFEMRTFNRPEAVVVSNFILLPDGRIVRDMDAVVDAAADVSRRYFGAGQFQVVTSADLPAEQRQSIVVELLSAMQGTIQAIRCGGSK